MGGVLDWSTTPDSNTTVDGVSIAEGMQAGLVNNGMRAIMALVREWQLDASGVVTAGAGNAYTITSNQGIAAYADGLRFSFRADRNNTGAATLNVDGRGAKALRKTAAGALTALAADDIVAEAVYDVVYDVSSDVFVLVNSPAPEVLPGLTATVTELNYTDGVTSAIQTQLNAKAPTIADPNADRIRFWDDSAGAEAWLTAGTGLTITDTTLSVVSETLTSVVSLSGVAPINVTTAITGAPSYVELWFNGMSLSSTGHAFVQLGDAGFVTTGYDSSGASNGSGVAATNGFIVRIGVAAQAFTGTMIMRRTPGTNIWIANYNGFVDGVISYMSGAGKVTLTGSLERIRVAATAANDFDGSGTVYAVYR